MKVYSSCFIGIALPQEYQEEFEKLLKEIKIIDANIETAQAKTPHITLYYLNKQSQNMVDTIIDLIKPKLSILGNSLLTVGGFDYFTRANPKVLYLNVIHPTPLVAFNKKLSEILAPYSDTDNMNSFHPHLTIGKMVNNSAKRSFIKNREKLRLRLDKIKWNFPCKEVILYGVDSSKSPQHQKKIRVIPII